MVILNPLPNPTATEMNIRAHCKTWTAWLQTDTKKTVRNPRSIKTTGWLVCADGMSKLHYADYAEKIGYATEKDMWFRLLAIVWKQKQQLGRPAGHPLAMLTEASARTAFS